MEYLVVFLMMVTAVGVVVYPLLKPQSELAADGPQSAEPLEELLSERDAAYGAIKELEFERELGNLSELDYLELRDEYRRKAARILEELDVKAAELPPEPEAPPAPLSVEDEIELAIQRLRERGARTGSLPAERECPLCGETADDDGVFCSNCGADLSRFCPGCGEQRQPGDRFCSACGTLMEAKS